MQKCRGRLSLTGDASYILQAILPYVEKTEHKLWMEQIRSWQKNDYKPVDSETELKPHQILTRLAIRPALRPSMSPM
mgnify:CR=1 FL=1